MATIRVYAELSSRRGAKKERAREKRRGKRAISEKQNREIQIQKWVGSIKGRSCKRKRLKVGLNFRYAQPVSCPFFPKTEC
jgi:hypothetical protein